MMKGTTRDDEDAFNKIKNNIRKSLDQAEKDVGTTQKLKLKTKKYFRFSIGKIEIKILRLCNHSK